jgi:hypothetical protein
MNDPTFQKLVTAWLSSAAYKKLRNDAGPFQKHPFLWTHKPFDFLCQELAIRAAHKQVIPGKTLWPKSYISGTQQLSNAQLRTYVACASYPPVGQIFVSVHEPGKDCSLSPRHLAGISEILRYA